MKLNEQNHGPETRSKATATIHPTAGEGVVRFGELEVPCLVLTDGTAVFTSRAITRVFAASKSGHLEGFIERIPGASRDMFAASKTPVRLPQNNALAECYPAEVLAHICQLYANGLAAGSLHPKQVPLALRALVILSACCTVGLTALAWEATGYDKIKARGALQAKLAVALRTEAARWQRLFRPEFFDALARLFRLELGADGHRPACFGAFLSEFFYEWFDKDVLEELRRRRDARRALPPGEYGKRRNHHQHLNDEVRQRFERHHDEVLILVKSSTSLADFRNRFNRVYRNGWLQLSLDGVAA